MLICNTDLIYLKYLLLQTSIYKRYFNSHYADCISFKKARNFIMGIFGLRIKLKSSYFGIHHNDVQITFWGMSEPIF